MTAPPDPCTTRPPLRADLGELEEFLLEVERERELGREVAESLDAARARAFRFARAAEAAARRLSADLPARLARDDFALASECGFSDAECERAARRALEIVSAAAFEDAWRREIEGVEGAASNGDVDRIAWPGLALVIGAGAIPEPMARAAIAAGMVSRRVLHRPASGSGRLVEALLAEIDASGAGEAAESAKGARRILAATWPRERTDLLRRAVRAADSIVVFGDGATIATVRSMASPDAVVLEHGPRTSLVAWAVEGADGPALHRAADAIAEDVLAYDQRGCLSPSAAWIVGGPRGGEEAVRALADALDRWIARRGLPRRIPPASALAIHAARAERALVSILDREGADATGAGLRRRLLASPGLPGWTLLVDDPGGREDSPLDAGPGYGTLRVGFARDWADFEESIRRSLLGPGGGDGWAGSGCGLQCVGVAPDAAAMPRRTTERLIEFGASRVCDAGSMQAPPPDWRHDGQPILPVRAGAGARRARAFEH